MEGRREERRGEGGREEEGKGGDRKATYRYSLCVPLVPRGGEGRGEERGV